MSTRPAKNNAADALSTGRRSTAAAAQDRRLSCPFCVASLTKPMRRIDGVREASVDRAREQALIEYQPGKVTPEVLRHTLVELGQTERDATKVRTFEENAEELRRVPNNLVTGAAFTVLVLVLLVILWFDLGSIGRIWPRVGWVTRRSHSSRSSGRGGTSRPWRGRAFGAATWAAPAIAARRSTCPASCACRR